MPKIIMIVDDESDIRTTVKAILEKNGYKIVTAISGDDCLKQIQGGAKPDLILMDIMMPGTPTREVIKNIKNIKIAFLSVVRITEAEKEGLTEQKNIVDYIQKPFDIEDLLKRVQEILEEK